MISILSSPCPTGSGRFVAPCRCRRGEAGSSPRRIAGCAVLECFGDGSVAERPEVSDVRVAKNLLRLRWRLEGTEKRPPGYLGRATMLIEPVEALEKFDWSVQGKRDSRQVKSIMSDWLFGRALARRCFSVRRGRSKSDTNAACRAHRQTEKLGCGRA